MPPTVHRVSFIENDYMELIFLSDMYKSYIEIEPKIIRDKENAERIGEERGREMGLVEGKEVGRDEGERNKAIKMAKKMLLKKKSIEEILEFTELTAEDIVKIKK